LSLKICKNEKCHVYRTSYRFPNIYRFCPYCANPLVEENEHEKPMKKQITDADMEISYRRLAKTLKEQ
jgi:hypothetical protein